MEKKKESNFLLTRGKWFEEFETGQQVISARRTITETDVINFAGLSGDFNPVHIDAEFGKQSIYGERVAHGLLVLSIAIGLLVQTGLLDGSLGAFREINHWKFRQPVLIGDTVYVVLNVAKKKAVPRMEGGLVEFKLDVTNQRDEVVMTGFLRVFILSDPAEL